MKINLGLVTALVGCFAFALVGCGKRTIAEKPPEESSPSAVVRSDATATNSSPVDRAQDVLRPLLVPSSHRPELSILQSVTPDHRTDLMDYFRSHRDPLERNGAAWALGFAGDEDAVELLVQALKKDYAGKALTGRSAGIGRNQELAAQNTIYALGLLAGRYDSAFSFLTNATTPRFWAEDGAWISEKGPDEFGILASLSIVAIGMSGRAEVPRILSEMKKQPLKNDLDPTPFARRFDGAVVDAAFYHALIRDRGRDSFLARFFGATDVIDADGSRARWETTEEGKIWMEWYNRRQ